VTYYGVVRAAVRYPAPNPKLSKCETTQFLFQESTNVLNLILHSKDLCAYTGRLMLLCEIFVDNGVVILMFSFLYYFGACVFALFLQLTCGFYNENVVVGFGKGLSTAN
jgi:hypothetical protein